MPKLYKTLVRFDFELVTVLYITHFSSSFMPFEAVMMSQW